VQEEETEGRADFVYRPPNPTTMEVGVKLDHAVDDDLDDPRLTDG